MSDNQQAITNEQNNQTDSEINLEPKDTTKDFPDGPEGELPVFDPIADFDFVKLDEDFMEEFAEAPWQPEMTFAEWNEKIENPTYRKTPNVFGVILLYLSL